MDCRRCGAQILAEDANLQTLVARCRRCNEVFSFAEEVGRGAGDPAPRRRVPTPEGMRVEDDGYRRRISWVWFGPAVLFLVLFCVCWDSFLLFWYTMAFAKNGPWLMFVFPLLHVAVGIGLTYTVVATLLNRTEVVVTPEQLTVRHGPVPWGGNRRLEAPRVRQVFCDEAQTRGRRGLDVTFRVNAVLDDDLRVVLLSGLDDRGKALFVGQQLEEWLGLPHQTVPGALA